MSNFYEDWISQSERIERIVKEAPRVARGKELKWVQTQQDARAALMIAPEVGFPTAGSVLMKAEIPVGWHTGAHLHGEEAIYIVNGEGFLVLDGWRYEFRRGTALHIPSHSPHQLFNTGTKPVVYLSGLSWHLEASVHTGTLKQLQEAGPNREEPPVSPPPERPQYWSIDGRRISVHKEEIVQDPVSRHGATYKIMQNANGFKTTAVSITHIMVDHPHSKSHSHSHLEAILYALEGRGYTEIGGKPYTWEEGDAVHVPPGMMHHQHFNPYDEEHSELRFGYGIRNWFENQWSGYKPVDKDLGASPLHQK